MRNPLVTLGLLGVADPLLANIVECVSRQRRMQLAEVYDPCLVLAERVAAGMQAAYAPSLKRMLRNVSGLVVLDAGWLGRWPLSQAVAGGRPVLILRRALEELPLEHLLELREAAQPRGVLIMPELRHRWTRSTLRLRELTATRLGAIESLEVEVRNASQGLGLLEVIDFCQTVIQSDFRSVESAGTDADFTLRFRRLNRDGEPVAAVIRPIPEQSAGPDLAVKVQCRHGSASLLGDAQVQWSAGRLSEMESLGGERTGMEVMLDLFGRRLAGGVVPVPDLGDILRASQVRAALSLSRARQTAVAVPLVD